MRTLAALGALALLFSGCDRKPPPPPVRGSGESEYKIPWKNPERIELGTFEVTSGVLVVRDPCYPLEPKPDGGHVAPAKNGRWRAVIVRIDAGNWGTRVAELIAFLPGAAEGIWTAGKDIIAVDSGQAGIFDRAHFANNALVPQDYKWKDKPIDEKQRWYSLCCEKTLEAPHAGVVPHGAVSSAGLGDGGYDWYFRKDGAGEVVAVKVVFLPE